MAEEITRSTSIEINYDNYVNMPGYKNGKIIPVGITNVRFGSGAPVCDVDVNELQEITQQQINGYDAILRSVLGIPTENNVIFVSNSSITVASNGRCEFGSRTFACIMGKIFELNNTFYTLQTMSGGYNIYLVATYNENINKETQLYNYGYIGSYNEEISDVARIGGTEIVAKDNYLIHGEIDGYEVGMETSRRCGYTYAIVTAKNAPSSRNGQIVLHIGHLSNSTVIFDGKDSIVTSKVEYHSHVNKETSIMSSMWKSKDSSGVAPYEATIEVPELAKHNSTVPIISLIPIGNSVDAKITEQDEYACISEVKVDGDSLTFICYENAPTVDLHINVKVV